MGLNTKLNVLTFAIFISFPLIVIFGGLVLLFSRYTKFRERRLKHKLQVKFIKYLTVQANHNYNLEVRRLKDDNKPSSV